MPETTRNITQNLDSADRYTSFKNRLMHVIQFNSCMNICRLNLPSYADCADLTLNLLRTGLVVANEISKEVIKDFVDSHMPEDLNHLLELHNDATQGDILGWMVQRMVQQTIDQVDKARVKLKTKTEGDDSTVISKEDPTPKTEASKSIPGTPRAGGLRH